MTGNEYFKDWWKLIDKDVLYKVIQIIKGLYTTHRCLPEYKSIFKVFNVTPYNKLCQVWLAQEPYNDINSPTGVAFANPNSKKILSPSLNVLKNSIIGFELSSKPINFAPDLSHLSNQGILLLNSSLTVEVGKPLSHSVYWREFTKSFLINLGKVNTGLIYVLWGNEAQSFEHFINVNNIVLKMPHPAWYARQDKLIPHEFFTKLSELNYEYYGRKIEWFTCEQESD